jgi:hypothetical protein
MSERRMFAKTIVTSDAFLDMPLSARCLYFTLGMLADDDGFVNNPKSIMRQVGASHSDLDLLLVKRFILAFDSGVIVIKHWRIHNYIQKDRYKESKYIEEKATLMIDEKGAYTECIQDVYKVDTQVRLGKDSLGKDRLVEGSVVPATATATEENQLKLIGGELGKNVVYLTDRQLGDLMDRLGLDAFNRYVEKLATFIIENNARIKSHYDTILKWYEEDSKVSGKPKGKAKHIDFDVDEAFERAIERTYGTEENNKR